MCNCISEIATNLYNRLDEEDNGLSDKTSLSKFVPKGGELNDVSALNLAINLSTGATVLQIPFKITWALPKGKSKKTTVTVNATHCPFCGASMEVKK